MTKFHFHRSSAGLQHSSRDWNISESVHVFLLENRNFPLTFITRFFDRDKKEVFVSCQLMFNPKLTRGCCWARAASWESFVWELFGNEYEHWPQE